MHCESKVRYFYWERDCFFLFLRAIVNIPILTLIISPWLLFRKMVILQLELGPSVDLPTCVPNSQSLDLSRWHLTIATHLLDYDIRRCGNVALFFANFCVENNWCQFLKAIIAEITSNFFTRIIIEKDGQRRIVVDLLNVHHRKRMISKSRCLTPTRLLLPLLFTLPSLKKDDIQLKMPYPYPSPVTFHSSPFRPWNKPDGEINIRLSLLWLRPHINGEWIWGLISRFVSNRIDASLALHMKYLPQPKISTSILLRLQQSQSFKLSPRSIQ